MPVKGASWYGNYGKFVDHQDNNSPASGIPNTYPSIAQLDRKTLGGYYIVKLPNGYKALAVHGDIGPSTGRVDINARLATDAGYGPNNFPTDHPTAFRYVGHNKAAAIAEANKVGAVVSPMFGGAGSVKGRKAPGSSNVQQIHSQQAPTAATTATGLAANPTSLFDSSPHLNLTHLNFDSLSHLGDIRTKQRKAAAFNILRGV